MSFFTFLASEKATSDESFRTASAEASREVNDRFSAFVSAYGDNGISLVSQEIETLVQGIADRHGVGDRSASIQKAALMGLTNNPLLDERKHWTQDDWNSHYQNLQGQQYPEADPNALTPRPELNGLNPNQPAPQDAHLQNPRGQTPALFSAKEGTPVPKMDKRKWTPKTVGPLKGVDDPKGPNPTRHLDADAEEWTKDGKPIPGGANKTKPDQIGEHRTERYDLNRDKQKA